MKYDKYKIISLPWLNEIPAHWKLIRNKNIMLNQKSEVGNNFAAYTLLSLTINGIIKRNTESGKGKFPKEFNKYKVVEKGDMVFCLFDIDETPRTVGLSNLDGMITGAYDVFKLNGINSEYVFYYYLALDNIKALKPLYTGLRKVIGVSQFLAMKLPCPPIAEQEQIVRYLKYKIEQIDKLIPQNDISNIKNTSNALLIKHIALLNEYKTTLMLDVITGKVDVRNIVVPEFAVVDEVVEDVENGEVEE